MLFTQNELFGLMVRACMFGCIMGSLLTFLSIKAFIGIVLNGAMKRDDHTDADTPNSHA